MRTMKVEVTPEPRQGIAMTITTECMVDTPDEAEQAGKEAYELVMSFMHGFGDDDQ